MYYTTRELSNRAAELPVLRSLGDEVLLDGVAGGEWWLQEHLRSNYQPGWTTLVRNNLTDAAIGDVGASRWANYYVEGMSNLACESARVDGVELDGLAFPRHTMARLRKVTEACRGNDTIFNTHSGDDFIKTRLSSVVNYMAHYSLIDSLMYG